MEFEKSGSSSMIWLVLAYFTIGELCLSRCIIIYYKIIPVKCFLMMVYFAATGLGNKVGW
jgi:POT family proton-dependent oligopeptide transporter